MVLWLNPTYLVPKVRNKTKISSWNVFNRDMLSIVSLGVLGEYTKSLLASFFLNILRVLSLYSWIILCIANNTEFAVFIHL
jgi:hypothetical protein